MIQVFRRLLFAGICTATLLLSGCVTVAPRTVAEALPELSARLRSLGPNVDAAEAERVASTALLTAQTLADHYRAGTSPYVHNVLVNVGIRDRGLCWHYAEDLHAALLAVGATTLEFRPAVSSPGSLLHEHNVIIATARGRAFETGIVLDPWRRPRSLHWAPVVDDPPYRWQLDTR